MVEKWSANYKVQGLYSMHEKNYRWCFLSEILDKAGNTNHFYVLLKEEYSEDD